MFNATTTKTMKTQEPIRHILYCCNECATAIDEQTGPKKFRDAVAPFVALDAEVIDQGGHDKDPCFTCLRSGYRDKFIVEYFF